MALTSRYVSPKRLFFFKYKNAVSSRNDWICTITMQASCSMFVITIYLPFVDSPPI
jgi:hypothetical protein